MTKVPEPDQGHRTRTNVRAELRLCPHGMHHPYPGNLDYPHSCDGCWCEGERDRLLYGWPHDSSPIRFNAETDADPQDTP